MKNKFDYKEHYKFNDLIKIMSLLRSENGCIWDREQNHKSIRNNFIEETYEAIEAIDTDNLDLLKEELGDVLLQVVFHAQIEKENNTFDIDDVTDGICKKLILRHPHVFGDTDVENTDQVLDNWNAIKQKEKKQDTAAKAMNDVARSLPALMRSQKIIKRASKAGLISTDINSSVQALYDVINEIKSLTDVGNCITGEQLGKMLMNTAKLAVSANIECEQALYDICEEYIKGDFKF